MTPCLLAHSPMVPERPAMTASESVEIAAGLLWYCFRIVARLLGAGCTVTLKHWKRQSEYNQARRHHGIETQLTIRFGFSEPG